MNLKPIISLFLFLFITTEALCQRVELIIDNKVYKSYVCTTYKVPLYVVYNLEDGGGDCDRKAYSFKDDPKCVLAQDSDYKYTGYDKGHLANAEDFAFDCAKEKATFCYSNCVPQTTKLNRVIWKSWEYKVRDLSHEEPLQIICGGIYTNSTIGSGVHVPKYCYKIVKSRKTGKYMHVLLFTNTQKPTVKQITLDELKAKLGYQLIIPNT